MSEYVALGSEITVNSTYARSQANGDIARLFDGTVISVWRDLQVGTTANQYIRAQRFDSDGNPIGTELTLFSGSNTVQSVAGLAGGGFVLVYKGFDLTARVYSADGVAQGSAIVLNPVVNTSSPNNADVIGLAGGGFAVVWDDSRTTGSDTSGTGVHLRTFDTQGNPVLADVLVNTSVSGNQADASITALAGGSFVVTWTDRGTANGWLIKAQVFNADGSRSGDVLTVNPTDGFASSVESSVTALAGGNFAVAWHEGSNHHIQVFDPAGGRVGAEILTPALLSGTQTGPVIAALSDGGLAIAWQANVSPLSDGSDTAIFAQAFDAAGNGLGDPMLANVQTNGSQRTPAIVALDDGAFMVTWTDMNGSSGDDDEVKARIFVQGSEVTFTSDGGGAAATVSLAEGTLAVTLVSADSTRPGASITYAIVGGADAALFSIDATSGALQLVSAPDFEAPADAGADGTYDIIVEASDGVSSARQTLSVAVTDVDEAPAFVSSAALAASENQLAIGTVQAVDPEGTAVEYEILGGADATRFSIDPLSGVLSFNEAPDFEAPGDVDGSGVYEVEVGAWDGANWTSQVLAITVTDSNEGPRITSNGGGASANVSISENTTAATVVTASDPESQPLTYSVIGGSDSARFTIDAVTGALSFVAAPDFEAPGDTGSDNVYEVIVQASDGSLTSAQTLHIAVINANEGPTITSGGGGSGASYTVAENTFAVATIAASDPDGQSLVYSIVGGADAARFTIDAATGALRFASAPNFEAPGDAGGDNVYDVVVQASDGSFVDTQALTVSITNLVDGQTITGTSAANVLTGTNAEDTINGFGGNDTISGGLGRDLLTGGSGNDTFVFSSLSDSMVANPDMITDFGNGKDKINLSAIDARTNASGDQAFTWIGTSAFTGVAGQLRYYQSGGDTFVTGDLNGDAVGDFSIAFDQLLSLSASSFVL